MNKSEKIDQWHLAVYEMHKKYGCVIDKNAKGNRGEYANLPHTLQTIRSWCEEFGLDLIQPECIVDGRHCIETIVTHIPTGQWRSSLSALTYDSTINDRTYTNEKGETIISALKSSDQAYGGSSTYHRRYSAMALLGLSASNDPADHDGWGNEIKQEPITVESRPIERVSLPSQKSGCINENQLRKFNAMAKDPKFPQNKQKAAGYIAKYGSAENIPWKVFNSIVEDMQSPSGPIQQQITEVFGDGELEEVF